MPSSLRDERLASWHADQSACTCRRGGSSVPTPLVPPPSLWPLARLRCFAPVEKRAGRGGGGKGANTSSPTHPVRHLPVLVALVADDKEGWPFLLLSSPPPPAQAPFVTERGTGHVGRLPSPPPPLEGFYHPRVMLALRGRLLAPRTHADHGGRPGWWPTGVRAECNRGGGGEGGGSAATRIAVG